MYFARKLGITSVAGLLFLVVHASAGAQSTMAKPAPLFDRLGGKPAITAVVNEFIGNVASDEAINARFAHADIAHLKLMLVDQICAGAGGPCVYTGKDMASAHRGMNIRDEEFTALVGDLVKALDKFKVPEREKGELLAILAPAKPLIVGQ